MAVLVLWFTVIVIDGLLSVSHRFFYDFVFESQLEFCPLDFPLVLFYTLAVDTLTDLRTDEHV